MILDYTIKEEEKRKQANKCLQEQKLRNGGKCYCITRLPKKNGKI